MVRFIETVKWDDKYEDDNILPCSYECFAFADYYPRYLGCGNFDNYHENIYLTYGFSNNLSSRENVKVNSNKIIGEIDDLYHDNDLDAIVIKGHFYDDVKLADIAISDIKASDNLVFIPISSFNRQTEYSHTISTPCYDLIHIDIAKVDITLDLIESDPTKPNVHIVYEDDDDGEFSYIYIAGVFSTRKEAKKYASLHDDTYYGGMFGLDELVDKHIKKTRIKGGGQ